MSEDWISLGDQNRATASTNMNMTSSRSHAVFSITVTQVQVCLAALSSFSLVIAAQSVDEGDLSKVSRVNLVDLAGSERSDMAGTSGERLRVRPRRFHLACVIVPAGGLGHQQVAAHARQGHQSAFREEPKEEIAVYPIPRLGADLVWMHVRLFSPGLTSRKDSQGESRWQCQDSHARHHQPRTRKPR